MKRLAQLIRAKFSVQVIHAMGVHRLEQKHFISDIAYRFQIYNHGRAAVHIFSFHAVNYITLLTANILEMEDCIGYMMQYKHYNEIEFSKVRDITSCYTQFSSHTSNSCTTTHGIFWLMPHLMLQCSML